MDETTIELVKQFGEKMELYGSNLFEIAMQQQMVYILQGSLSLVGILILLGISLIGFKKLRETLLQIEGDDAFCPITMSYILQVGFSSFLLMLAKDIIFNLIQWYINPEYQVILEIIKLIHIN